MSAKQGLLDGERGTFSPPPKSDPVFHEKGGSPREVGYSTIFYSDIFGDN